LFKFGEKGSRVGQFCYPWDIDCCAQSHHIVVSDTRNRRIQLFTSYGQYITHFALLLDSPRGVAFLPDKRLVVSDFNKHRILVFDKIGVKDSNSNGIDMLKNGGASSNQWNANGMNGGGGGGGGGNANNMSDQLGHTSLGSPKIIGFGEGSQWGEFLRPQGIAVNGNHIFCADSRNNRISVYNLLTHTFEYLNEGLDLDRPSDLAVIDDNLLVVVDFGNNRLQILQR
jgi:tripartite motif-containing protein 71